MAPASNNLKRKNREADNEIPTGNAAIKKKIRDTERALRRPTLTAKVRLELERKLKALNFHSSEKLIDDFERTNAKKYHMVKHFERTKVNRKIKKAEKELKEAKSDEEKKSAQKLLDQLNIDLNYINHFPNTERYISLYPSSDSNEASSEEARKEIRDRIGAATKDGEFDEDAVRKHYRNKYRDHLVKSGKISAIEASADDIAALSGQKEEDQVKPNKKSKTAKASKEKAGKPNAVEKADVEQDDFFMANGDSDNEE
ncbi:hypothetical protein INT44_004759 [Umbelopsis vinacea]|uniref:rRNA-processing protein EFG1 n=1 Tax=Umbelopsis vinacea TaxID=44442 RepID=A0A8H7UQC7_9FUNG|nr:hypothetical protein INT44_004759 [Umbelopsis vinacea]